MTKDQITKTFIDLVSIDSPSGEESLFAKYLINRLGKIGLKFTIDSAGNIYTRKLGAGEPVLICAHLDTVQPGRGIKAKVQQGILKSDGTTILGADNKAAIAAIISVLESAPLSQFRSFELLFTTGEETIGGVNHFDFRKIKARTGLIADHSASIGGIVMSAPGIVNLDIKIIGRPAHASHPESAVNALTIAAKAYSQIKWGRANRYTTTNIGLISAGSAMNTIPGDCHLVGEIRSFSPQLLKKTENQIGSVFERTAKLHQAGLDYKVGSYCQAYIHKKSHPAVKQVLDIFDRLKITPYFEQAFGASDANALNSAGIAVVTIADGCRYPHTTREQISQQSLFQLAQIFSAYLEASQ